ncbi:DUF488 family protein [Janthinobacterium rivuli]|uniref:DUF488 domain-containing protein n=1 Tax=Janthinobacterium rivuli TaxID=2751478 RepID=UPI00383A17F9
MTTSETPFDFRILSIGFTGKNAERFFTLLKNGNVKTLFDVRLQNTSQLAGFAKRDDLKYFLKNICDIDYVEIPELYPEANLLKDYKNKVVTWDYYQEKYLELLSRRSVESVLSPSLLDNGCLLCSEHKPHQCHRRLAIEYLKSRWVQNFKIEHLV